MERRRYLNKVSLERALSLWLEHPACRRRTEPETLPTHEALGRVTAAPVFARRSVPHFHCSAVNGIAVRAADTFDASETRPCRIPPAAYTVVDTGDPIPEDRDAVAMIEEVRWMTTNDQLPTTNKEDVSLVVGRSSFGAAGGEPHAAEIHAAVAPWQHVRLAGEDLVATEMVLTRGHRLRPADVAALLSCGVTEVAVHRRPRVAILPTGDELVDATATLEPGSGSATRLAPGRIPRRTRT